jgi:hypothetical protein
LTEWRRTLRPYDMDVHLTPETESGLNELALQSGRPPDDLVEGAMAGYLAEAPEGAPDARQPLRRYQERASEPIDGEEAFERLRARVKSAEPLNRERLRSSPRSLRRH